MSAAFDTYAFVKRLTGAGMPEAQAEVLADEQVFQTIVILGAVFGLVHMLGH